VVAHNLPTHATPFIGRTGELSRIAALLHDPGCRLLTLTGPGGIGKTRLAVEVARLMTDDDEVGAHGHVPLPNQAFSDGVCFVPLQPLTSPDVIVPAIADALHFTVRRELAAKQQLLGYLREKRLLLVLDNIEHLTDGVELLPEILEQAPHLKLLVTSQERLRLREEWLFDVSGLSFPENAQTATSDGYTAVQLFFQSARRAGYTPVNGDTSSIVRICQLSQGIPLAVELAAAWVRVMPCAEIALEVERSLDILTTTNRNVPEKHRSMRAAFERSWELLTGEEQAVFRKLSVFRGGFSREGAGQVAGATLAILASLVDKSLVEVDASGRYELHGLLRQYAADRLRDAGEEDTTVQRHCDYFIRLAEGAKAHAFGREQVAWFDRLEVELDNLRAVLIRLIEQEAGFRLVAALRWFFTERSHWGEGIDWFRRALAANPDAPAFLRVQGLQMIGEGTKALALARAANDRFSEEGEQALVLARAANNRWNIAWSLAGLGIGGDVDIAQRVAYLDESLTLFRELDDAMGITHTLIRRSWQARLQDDYSRARLLTEEAAMRAREAGDRACAGWASLELGVIARYHDDDLSQAKSHLETSLAFFREARIQSGVHISLTALAAVELMMGSIVQAQRHTEEALTSFLKIEPDNHFVLGVLAVKASIAKAQGQRERAARLLGAASTNIRPWVRITFFDSKAVSMDSETAAVREHLGEAAFAEAWEAGKGMTREQAIAYALDEPASAIEPANPSETASRASQPLSESLTAREREVLSLVASGLSNREIAGKLFVTVHTVKWYLKGIFSKLHVANRVQAVARARDLGLSAQGNSRVDSG
jgi:predicted ATPase/DNA-binding CsgD family transcriptional regulator